MIFENAIKARYRQVLFSRCDDRGDIYYLSHADFPGLNFEPFDFHSKEGALLRGGFYSYNGEKSGEVIVFEHGIGGGHRSYISEIEHLARHGYTVYAYDHTGCMASGGEGALGFAHALCDLDFCIRALKEKLPADTKFSLVGHSQGGFAVMNITKYHKDIRAIVSISGFISVRSVLRDTFSGPLSLYRRALFRLEHKTSGEYAEANAIESLAQTDANVLIIHSADDKTVSYKGNFEKLREALAECENIKFLSTDGKNHNPNYTKEAVEYLKDFFRELKEHRKNKHADDENAAFIKKFDFFKMTEQDTAIFEEIFKTLDK